MWQMHRFEFIFINVTIKMERKANRPKKDLTDNLAKVKKEPG